MNYPSDTSNKNKFMLPRRNTYEVGMSKPGLSVTCEKGILWVTLSGESEDHILGSGDSLLIFKRGKLVIEAMEDSTLRINRENHGMILQSSNHALENPA